MNDSDHVAERRHKLHAWLNQRPQILADGEVALRRLLPIAQRDSGQSRRLAHFLLGLYNGARFPFDLTDLRCLDLELFEDCMSVLRMDFKLEKEVHRYFQNGSEVFEQLARDWLHPNAYYGG